MAKAIKESNVIEGAIFLTKTNQVRKVFKVWTDDKGVKKVLYRSKSKNYPHRSFSGGPTLAGVRMEKKAQPKGKNSLPK